MEQLKQQTINKAVASARKQLSDGKLVTASDEAIAWMADQIEAIEKPINDTLPLVDATPRIVEILLKELDISSLTVDTYTVIVALGSMAKQLKAFDKHSETVDKINQALIRHEFEPSKVGCKL